MNFSSNMVKKINTSVQLYLPTDNLNLQKNPEFVIKMIMTLFIDRLKKYLKHTSQLIFCKESLNKTSVKVLINRLLKRFSIN